MAGLGEEDLLRGNMKPRGFTLVEILIVMVIIALLATVAIPNFMRSRHNANETAAVVSMRTLTSALESYRGAQTPFSYPPGLNAMNASNPAYIDSVLASGTKQGYNFTYTLVGVNQFTLTAVPMVSGITGTRTFYVDQTGVIRVSALGTADAGSPPLD